MKGERRRGGIYRSWIVKGCQKCKREGVFVKWEGEVTLMATWPIMMGRREWGCLGNDNLEGKHLMRREKGG